jgi:hypothetical protein
MSLTRITEDFIRAGWYLGDLFSRLNALLIGYGPDEATSHLSICAWESVWNSKEPVFDLYDHERNTTVWVRGVPTPQRAAELLAEYGLPGCSGLAEVEPEDATVDAW